VALMTPIAWAYLETGSPYYPWSWVVRILCGFGAGVLTHLTVRRLRAGDRLRRRASVLAAATPLVIAAGLLLGEYAGAGRGGVVIVLLPLLVGAIALADRGPAMVLSLPWMVQGGRISYSLYLVHIPMFEVYWLGLRRFAILGPHTVLAHVLAVVVILSTLVVASVAFRFVEEPARRRMRRIQLPAGRRAIRRPGPAPTEGPFDLVTAFRAAREALVPAPAVPVPGGALLAPEPRHAASGARRPTLAATLVNAQRRPAMHRAELMASYDRAAYVRTGGLDAAT
jgi:peptidoglycan/LPS O-acetylase OafA/YrhL